MNERIQIRSLEVSLKELESDGCQRIFEFWNARRGDSFAPRWRDFPLIELPPDCVPYVHVLDVLPSEPEPVLRFRFWGTGLVEMFRMERTGQILTEPHERMLNDGRRRAVADDCARVIESRQPMAFLWDGSSVRDIGYSMVLPSIRLPISGDGETVSQIVTFLDLRSVDRQHWQHMFESAHPQD